MECIQLSSILGEFYGIYARYSRGFAVGSEWHGAKIESNLIIVRAPTSAASNLVLLRRLARASALLELSLDLLPFLHRCISLSSLS